MAVSLTVVGVAFLSIDDSVTAGASTATSSGRPSDAGIIMLVALVVYIASFAFSMGPIVWTMINEIYPRSVRGRAVSVATAANWFSAWVVSQFFLSVVDAVGESVTFWIFAALSVVCLVWIVAKVPETRGRTLEEIEAMWGGHDPTRVSVDGATAAPPAGATGA
jgi:MFS family permease